MGEEAAKIGSWRGAAGDAVDAGVKRDLGSRSRTASQRVQGQEV